ncbi:restriction endonuclease subunit S [Halocynthiibacter namhaensis]|uniref:restriction endonuclease subunit S n=1 Tax=Halocynthiibacter namhaensis TaxID=1290553 RepID=UPI0009DE16AF|nr:restriction endonuclease subunit S [Halocynthiibacter namhaensis]
MTGPVQAKYKPYPAYKPSGVEWLGDIPEGWETRKAKHLFRIETGGTPLTSNDENFSADGTPWVKPDDLKELSPVSESQRQVSRKGLGGIPIIPKGSILVCGIGTVGKFGIAGVDVITNQQINSFIPKINIVSPRYAVFSLSSASEQIAASANRVVVSISNKTSMQNISLCSPPLHEQTKIATFLDYETAKIDALIAKQQRLIALLEEKRQAVISHAVTKGLDPTAPRRPSGIDWLGDVPEHWEVKLGKHLFEFVTSGSRGWAEYYSDEGALFFRITNLTRDTIHPKLKSLQYVTPPRGSEGERSKIALGDLLISITADLGSVCVADESLEGGYVSQHVALCRPNGEVFSADWLGYTILSDASKFQLLESGYGGTKIQLSLPDLRELVLVKPPESEQIEIADFLDGKLQYFAKTLKRATQQITLLKERRTALISAAVTGKIDLRDWHMPEGGLDASNPSNSAQDISTTDIDQMQEAGA